ncbi:hypothetical protein C8R45DRAFT_1115377 [Mycena sanguinolenta]|nr:hypothetical protein C8R45DRAFT_1115377 [Mycena sanguinolenta]
MPPRETLTSSHPVALDGKNAIWTHADTVKFLDFLISKSSAAGDGGNFKMSTFNAAAKFLNETRERGGHKTGKGCSNKYKNLRSTLAVVEHLKYHASGFTYSDEKGADIDDASASAWDTYIVQHPDAKKFRNKGWPYMNQMEKLVPSKAKGTHVFRPGAAADPIDSRMNTPAPADGASDQPHDGAAHSPAWDHFHEEEEEEEGNGAEKEKEKELEKEAESSDYDRSSVRASSSLSHGPECIKSLPLFLLAAAAANTLLLRLHRGEKGLPNVHATLQSFFATPAPAAAAPAAGATASGSSTNTQIYQPSPVRKTDAVLRAQRKEHYLGPSNLAIICDILGSSAAKADIYNALVVDAVRIGWIQEQLHQHTAAQGLDFSTV